MGVGLIRPELGQPVQGGGHPVLREPQVPGQAGGVQVRVAQQRPIDGLRLVVEPPHAQRAHPAHPRSDGPVAGRLVSVAGTSQVDPGQRGQDGPRRGAEPRQGTVLRLVGCLQAPAALGPSSASAATAVALESARKVRQRCASSSSPIRPAATPSACSARRNPRFGSCSQGTGPCPFQPLPAQGVQPPVVAGPRVGVALDRAAGGERLLGQHRPRQARRRVVGGHLDGGPARGQLALARLVGQLGRRRLAEQVASGHGRPMCEGGDDAGVVRRPEQARRAGHRAGRAVGELLADHVRLVASMTRASGESGRVRRGRSRSGGRSSTARWSAGRSGPDVKPPPVPGASTHASASPIDVSVS